MTEEIFKKPLLIFNQKRLIGYSLISFLLSIVVFIICLNNYFRDTSKNFLSAKSIMKPEMIDSFSYSISHLKKDYNFSKDENTLLKNLFTFRTKLEKFGMELKEQNFEYENKKGKNYYSILYSRKEGNAKYYLLAFDYNNPYELLVISAFLENFFQRSQTLALNLILLGKDQNFNNFSIGTDMFLKEIYSKNKLIKSLNFMRDGINLEIKNSSAKESALFVYPCKLKRRS